MFEELIGEGKKLLQRINEHDKVGVDALPPEKRLTVAEVEAWYIGVGRILEHEFGFDSREATLWREGLAAVRRQAWEALGRGESPRGSSWTAHDLAESLGVLAQIKLLRRQAATDQALPFEIERFPDAIRERVPQCDPTIVSFVEEAIRCYKADALLGTAFLLGAASERAINLLIHAYADAIEEPSNRDKFLSRITGRMISKKFEEFQKSYSGSQSRPTDPVLSQDLDVIIGTVFQFYRVTRNEIGHPRIVPDLEKGVVLASLANFVTYIGRIYGLMKHFQDNGVIV